jgi:hypothetical protein
MAYGVTIQEEEGGLFLMLTLSKGQDKHHVTAIFLSDDQVEKICRGDMALRLECVPAEQSESEDSSPPNWGGPRSDTQSQTDCSTEADGTE